MRGGGVTYARSVAIQVGARDEQDAEVGEVTGRGRSRSKKMRLHDLVCKEIHRSQTHTHTRQRTTLPTPIDTG